MTSFWHGYADMGLVPGNEIVMSRGDGVWIHDTEGNRYLDATASLWYCNVGHGRREIAGAVADQMADLAAYSTFGFTTTVPTRELADRLVAMAPIDDAVVFMTTGGSDAIETAAKLIRRYWNAVGRPEKRIFVTRELSYHGMNAWGTELGGLPSNSEGYGGPLVPHVIHVPTHDTSAVADLFERESGRIAAFVGEPVIGSGGVVPPADGYWPEIERLCRAHDVLLVADEVITGFGRVGRDFGVQHYGFTPDVIAFAKGVTSGYAPLGGVLISPRIREPFWDGRAIFRHGYTYSGHAASCAAALVNLDILEREGLVARVAELGPILASGVRGLESHPVVDSTRSAGLLAAVVLSEDALAEDPGLLDAVVRAAFRRGIITIGLRGAYGVLQISPPFVITESEIDHMLGGLADAVSVVATERGFG